MERDGRRSKRKIDAGYKGPEETDGGIERRRRQGKDAWLGNSPGCVGVFVLSYSSAEEVKV